MQKSQAQQSIERARLEDFLWKWMKRAAIGIFLLAAAIFIWPIKASAQTTTVTAETQAQVSACYTLTYTKNLKGDYKKLLKVMCEKEIHEAGSSTPVTTGPIGVATDNKAVTTVTYRNANGEAFEASKGGAKLKLDLRKEDRKEKVGVAKATQTIDYCGGWNPPAGCMYRSGSFGGGYGSIGTGTYVQPYQSPR